jgi:hypothetical protein
MVRDAYAFGKPVELMGIPNITILFLNMTPTYAFSRLNNSASNYYWYG